MKTKTLSNNRITRSHTTRASELSNNRQQPTQTKSTASVSKRENGAILRQVQEIRESWTNTERTLRAELGAQRRAELCHLLFGLN